MANVIFISFLLFIVIQQIIPCVSEPNVVISFGSCNRQQLDNPIFKRIYQMNPDAYIWAGDAAYVDTRLGPGNFIPPTPTEHLERFEKVSNNPNYVLMKKTIPIFGVWDDHDYGLNNGGRDLPIKDRSREIFLNFLDVPASSPRRNATHGISTVHWIEKGGTSVAIVLLDVRWGMSPNGLFSSDFWNWFRQSIEEISKKNPDLTLFVSGIQVIPTARKNRGVGRFTQELWELWPRDKKMFFEIIKEYRLPRIALLSGDVHFGELLQSGCSDNNDYDIGYPVLELTSSGQTHTWASLLGKLLGKFALNHIVPHKNRLLEPVVDFNFGTVSISSNSVTFALWGPESGKPPVDTPIQNQLPTLKFKDATEGANGYYPLISHTIPLNVLSPAISQTEISRIQQYCHLNKTKTPPFFPFEVIFILIAFIPIGIALALFYFIKTLITKLFKNNPISKSNYKNNVHSNDILPILPHSTINNKTKTKSSLGLESKTAFSDPEFRIYKYE